MHRLPTELLELDEDGSWIATLIYVHNEMNKE